MRYIDLQRAALLTLVIASCASAQAPHEATLFGFDVSNWNAPAGSAPSGRLMRGPDGSLYGTTVNSGTNGGGTAFRLSPPAPGQTKWSMTVLHEFSTAGLEGDSPMGGLVMDRSGALYGTTNFGGESTWAQGVVFRLTPPKAGETQWTESVLHTFDNIDHFDGAGPVGSLLMDRSGALYGVTKVGGKVASDLVTTYGVVFKMTPPGPGQTEWSETILYAFNGSDGASPQGGLTADASGALYGATYDGGIGHCGDSLTPDTCGVIFKLTPPKPGGTQWTHTTLYRFNGSDGGEPQGDLFIDHSGAVYGTTFRGGPGNCFNGLSDRIGCGVVFKLTPPPAGHTAWSYSTVHTFEGPDGYGSNSGLIADAAGNLWGSASGGGTWDFGVVFKLEPPAPGQTVWTESVPFSFYVSTTGSNADTTPIGDGKGHLFGTTFTGGPLLGGVVYELTP